MRPGPPKPPAESVDLRDVVVEDLPIFFEHQHDPEANRLAAFPARERDAFDPHWERILRDETTLVKTIVADGRVAGNVLSFERDGERLVGYWIGREHWGRGIASRALAAFLRHETRRPLFARVAQHNAGSIRVLEKCGFTLVRADRGPSDVPGEEVDDFVYGLD